MNASVASRLTFTFVLGTLCVGLTISQQVIRCDIFTTRNPRGLCGDRLATAHTNLCSILRIRYPHLFPTKRSVDNTFDKVYSLAELDLGDDDLGAYVLKKDIPYRSETDGLSGANGSSAIDKQMVLPGMKRATSELFRVLKSSGSRLKRQGTSQRNIVCECCYNVCPIRVLATYC